MKKISTILLILSLSVLSLNAATPNNWTGVSVMMDFIPDLSTGFGVGTQSYFFFASKEEKALKAKEKEASYKESAKEARTSLFTNNGKLFSSSAQSTGSAVKAEANEQEVKKNKLGMTFSLVKSFGNTCLYPSSYSSNYDNTIFELNTRSSNTYASLGMAFRQLPLSKLTIYESVSVAFFLTDGTEEIYLEQTDRSAQADSSGFGLGISCDAGVKYDFTKHIGVYGGTMCAALYASVGGELYNTQMMNVPYFSKDGILFSVLPYIGISFNY